MAGDLEAAGSWPGWLEICRPGAAGLAGWQLLARLARWDLRSEALQAAAWVAGWDLLSRMLTD